MKNLLKKIKLYFHRRKIIWKTADGRELSLVQIDNDHLINIIYHLKERHEIACLRAEQFWNAMGLNELLPYKKLKSQSWPIYNIMVEEAKLRGISNEDW